MFTAGISRVPGIRWMADGKYYSCSDSICSFDMVLSVVADLVDIDVAVKAAACLGYKWDFASEEGILV